MKKNLEKVVISSINHIFNTREDRKIDIDNEMYVFFSFKEMKKILKEKFCERSLRYACQSLQKKSFIRIVRPKRRSSNCYIILNDGYDFLSGKKDDFSRDFGAAKKEKNLPLKNEDKTLALELFSRDFGAAKKEKNLPLYIYNKSNKSNKSFMPFEKKEPVLVRVLYDHAVSILGDDKVGRLDRKVACWLHSAYKKLGSSVDSFVSFLKETSQRKWLTTRSWFSLSWLLKFDNMDKILSGAMKDFENKVYKKVETKLPIVLVGDEEKKFNVMISDFISGRKCAYQFDNPFEILNFLEMSKNHSFAKEFRKQMNTYSPLSQNA